MTSLVRSLLKQARDLFTIQPHRWTKGHYAVGSLQQDELPERMCLVGLLSCLASRDGIGAEQANSAYVYVMRSLPPNGWGDSVPAFNDSPEIEHKDVLNVLNRALSLADMEGVE